MGGRRGVYMYMVYGEPAQSGHPKTGEHPRRPERRRHPRDLRPMTGDEQEVGMSVHQRWLGQPISRGEHPAGVTAPGLSLAIKTPCPPYPFAPSCL